MNITIISKIVRINIIRVEIINVELVSILKEDSKINNKCPATILAINRIESVRGRMIFLTVSIKTMKDINKMGVPMGVRWEKKLDHLFFKAIITLESHIIIANGRFNLIWDVADIINGNKDNKLKKKINNRRVKKYFLEPLFLNFFLNKLEISFWNSFLIPKRIKVV